MDAMTPNKATPTDMALEVNRLLEDVRGSFNRDLNAAKSSAASLAALLASKAAHDGRRGSVRGGLAPWQKLKVENYIESKLDETILIVDLAKLVSLSTSHFCRAFKDSQGETPHAYVMKKRIDRARLLMLTTSESLSQIAVTCGLADQSHFSRCFRQIMGAPPGCWRRRHAVEPQPACPTVIDEGESRFDQRGFAGAPRSISEESRRVRLSPVAPSCLSA